MARSGCIAGQLDAFFHNRQRQDEIGISYFDEEPIYYCKGEREIESDSRSRSFPACDIDGAAKCLDAALYYVHTDPSARDVCHCACSGKAGREDEAEYLPFREFRIR